MLQVPFLGQEENEFQQISAQAEHSYEESMDMGN